MGESSTSGAQAAVRGSDAPHVRLLEPIAALKNGEGRCVLLFFSYAFLLLVCYYVLKTVREPLLLTGGSAALKSYAYATVAAVLLVLVPLYGIVVRRVGKSRVALCTTLFFVANLGIFYAAARAGADVGFAYYVWVGVFGVTVVAQFWAHAADAFTVDSGQRLFPVIVAGATLGGLAGPLVARALYDAADPTALLLVAAAILVATLPLVGWTRDSVPPASRGAVSDAHAAASSLFGGFALIARDRYLLLAALMVVLLNCVNTTGEYILSELVIDHVDAQIALDPSLDKGALIAQFYSGFLFAVNALTVIAQLFIVGRVFRSVGVAGALLVLPVVALLGYVLVAFVPIFVILQVIKVVENAADYSITNTARHALYLPVPAHAKHESKVATDTFFWRFGDLLQGGIVFAGLNWFGFEIRHFAALNLLLAAVWVVVVWQLGRRYSACTGTPPLPLPAVAARRALQGLAVGPRAVLVRGATAWFAVLMGLAAVSASAPADASTVELISASRRFAASEPVCEALRRSNHNTGVPLLRGSPLTDEAFVERLRAATRALVLCTLSVSTLSHGQEALDASVVVLTAGVPVTRSQHADEPLVYAFDAQRGQALLIEVEQRGLDVIVSVQAPSGDVLRFNSPLQRSESELVLVDDATAGRYRVTVASEEPTNASGSHTISLSSLDAGARLRYGGALREMSEGARANAESRFSDSLQHYERSTLLWRELGDVRRQAQSQYGEAMLLYWSLRDWRPAADRATAAAVLYEQSGERFLHANALLTKGYSLMEIASAGTEGPNVFEQALTTLHESAALHQAMGNDYELAIVENFTGLTYFYRGHADAQDFREAEKHYRRSADLFARLGEWREELNARHNLALISIDEGYAANAARTLEEILADIPAGKDPDFRGSVLANLGVAYRDSGNYDAALVALSEAATIYSSLRNLNFEAYSLRVLGTTYQALGELERADQFLRQALEKAVERGRVRSAVLAGLGTVAYQQGDYAAALDWHQQSVHSTTSTVDRAYRQGFVVRDLVALRRFDEAIAAGVEVLSGADTPAISKADAALELGHAYLGLGQAAKAGESFGMALEVYDAARIANKQAEALNGRALAARASGDLAAAIQFGEDSLQRIESLRAGVSSPELRAFYSAAQSDYYETQIELLLDAAHAGSAFEPRYLSEALSVSERARARMIVDLLSEAAVRLDSGNLSEEALERERRLYDELGALRYQRDRLLERPNVEAAALEPLVRRMIAIENEISLASIAVRVGETSAGVATPLAAAEIQASLDEGSVLLQYSLGSPNSIAWVVTRTSLQVVELPDRATIEAAARKVYDGLKIYRPAQSTSALATPRAELAALVIAPILPFVGAAKQRLIIAADGALDYVPFGVLPSSLDGETVPLLQAFEVSNVPSMSAVAAQRRRAVQPAPKTLAIFADPVFAATDSRLASSGNVSAVPVAGPFPQAPVRLERLPATGAEATAIGELVSDDQRLLVTGFDASRERVLDAPLRDYRMVHFATHGLVDSRYPGLSALAFSQFDAAGRPQNGLLRLQDVYRLDLNADFVVLSGCETALGREIRGEGLIGLADGFLYAGARNLVVSLWQVPDRATAELMTRFYGYVLKDSLRPAEALRRAQRSIASEPRWSDPYFWGAFVVLGDS